MNAATLPKPKNEFHPTELGLIPSDWSALPLSEFISSLDAGVSVNSSDQEGVGADLPCILKTSCVSGGYFIPEEAKPILRADLRRAKTKPESDSIIISRMNTPALVGECGYVGRDYDNLYLPDRLWLTRHRRSLSHSVRWLAFVLSAPSLNKTLKDSATGTSGSMKNIPKPALLAVKVPTPPTKKEQEAIAEALSDADALIESLEALIAKKRAIKHGAMQDLLSGRKRLPGFSGEWRTTKIGDFTDCTAGGTPSTSRPEYWGGNIPWMSSGELHQKQVYEVQGRITELGLQESAAKMLPSNCVLVGLAGQGKTRGTVAINRIPLCTNQSIGAILPNEVCSSDFLFHNLDARYDELRELSAGDGGRGGLNLDLIRKISISLPNSDEQDAICIALTDFDAEIRCLDVRLDKARQIKQGMMQELLTGRVRLV